MFYGSLKGLWHNKSQFVTTKLKAYGFPINALHLKCSHLKNRRQSVQINNNFSSAKKVHAGVSQGSIDGCFLFNLFINDYVLFFNWHLFK